MNLVAGGRLLVIYAKMTGSDHVIDGGGIWRRSSKNDIDKGSSRRLGSGGVG